MKRALLIATAIAAVIAGRAVAENAGDQAIDEKCYGVSPSDVSECGSDPQTCARTVSTTPGNDGSAQVSPPKPEDVWAYVPKGTCVKIYHGSLVSKTS